MSIIDFIKKRKNVICSENQGIQSAVHLINEMKERTFTFKGVKKKYTGLSGSELLNKLQEEMDRMLIMYRYSSKIKTYTDKAGIFQAKIKIIGKTSAMSRYNPLNVEMQIKTEFAEK